MIRDYITTAQYFMNIISDLANEILESDDENEIHQLFALQQDYAIKLGTLIENRIGEGTIAVKKLEELCEAVFVADGLVMSDDYGIIWQKIFGLIENIRKSIDELSIPMEVVFLPYRYTYWDSVKDLYKMFCKEEDAKVYIVPIPYYDRLPDGGFGECNYEEKLFDEPIVDYREYRVEERFPDIIIIQNVQENSNYGLSVDNAFYAENLKTFTPNLIYVSPFIIDNIGNKDERSMYGLKFYVTVPGMAFVDKIIVQSEDIRELYIKELTGFVGKETESVWKEKVDLIDDYISSDLDKTSIISPVSDKWKEQLIRSDGTRKKVILFGTIISSLLQYEDQMINKLNNIFDTFEKNKEDVVVIWRTDRMENSIKDYNHELWLSFKSVVDKYVKNGIILYDESDSDEEAVLIADAYYGDPCVMATKIRQRQKPVMIMNVLV